MGGNVYRIFPGGIMLLVPALAARLEIILRVHRDLGHMGVNRAQKFLHKDYWWNRMEEDVKNVISGCNSCVRAKAVFRDP